MVYPLSPVRREKVFSEHRMVSVPAFRANGLSDKIPATVTV